MRKFIIAVLLLVGVQFSAFCSTYSSKEIRKELPTHIMEIKSEPSRQVSSEKKYEKISIEKMLNDLAGNYVLAVNYKVNSDEKYEIIRPIKNNDCDLTLTLMRIEKQLVVHNVQLGNCSYSNSYIYSRIPKEGSILFDGSSLEYGIKLVSKSSFLFDNDYRTEFKKGILNYLKEDNLFASKDFEEIRIGYFRDGIKVCDLDNRSCIKRLAFINNLVFRDNVLSIGVYKWPIGSRSSRNGGPQILLIKVK